MATTSTGAIGFVFEELMTETLGRLAASMAAAGWTARTYTEQGIRDEFAEQSLNGVDHLFEVVDPSGATTLFLLQEKWKILTNQREVSQFLDCCARILVRIPEARRQRVYRLWVTRSHPSANGEKSHLEGGAYTVQCSTSMPFLAQITAQFICELLGQRGFAEETVRTMPNLLTSEHPSDPDLLYGSKMTPSSSLKSKTKITVNKKS